jgi:AHBA synthesis associated protein
MLKAVIFDLDGVLIDSEPVMRIAFEESYRRVMGQGTPPIEQYLEHMGESFPRIMDHLGLPHALWQPYREAWQRHQREMKLFPECVDVLKWARRQQLKLGILTGKDRARTLLVLDQFGLTGFFDVVVGSDQLRCAKPDPEGMYASLAALQAAPEEAVMIGDAVSDIECAQRN